MNTKKNTHKFNNETNNNKQILCELAFCVINSGNVNITETPMELLEIKNK